jgi:DNA-directed RNA polymerase specialized sigma24 family protein
MRYDSSVASDPPAMDDGLSAFERARPRLLGLAYRMLVSVAEAEDVVQDVWTRWQSTVRDPQAFLATTTTRVAINVLQSARTRRETYVGPWLPEPVDTSADPNTGRRARRGVRARRPRAARTALADGTRRIRAANPSTTRIASSAESVGR